VKNKNNISDLEKYFKTNEGREIRKYNHYFDIYDRHFKRFRDKEVVILEIGVSNGGSLQMWKEYFGKNAKIYGIDIDPRCKEFEEDNIKIFIGSQSDRDFLKKVKVSIPMVDILIDDGGHTMRQQRTSFEELFDYIKNDGVYLIEDLHTSYWALFGGGHKRRNTFIEYSKNFIDYLNAFHSEQKSLKIKTFTKSVDSLHYYDSILVIEKKTREKPFNVSTGEVSFEVSPEVNGIVSRKLIKTTATKVNRILRFLRLPGIYRKL
jgi:23S rRNA U2552 (ribose-2'-O)-methylase RlmE/FtsJ|tara:strand:+ start:277 stop:1065 length:789 start_codon:yes stop_codon:yes gene_type:complete